MWGYFLGQPKLIHKVDGSERPIKLHSRQGLALLAYLLEQGEEVSRAQLIDFLWPEEEALNASASFRVMLAKVKKALPGALEITRYTVRLRSNTIAWDTLQFMNYAQNGDLESLKKATALYRGEFMQGFTLSASAEFDTWLEEQRENWIEAHNQVMRRLVDGLLDQQDTQKAIQHVERWLKLEPRQERAHRQRMWLYWQSGEVDKALQHYRQYARQLEREYGEEPAEDTQKLYHTILQDKKDSFQEFIRMRTIAPNSFSSQIPLQDPFEVYQLNASLTSFVGREDELRRLDALMKNSRLVTVRGAGGVGKTRLAWQYSISDYAQRYKDGVVFSALENTSANHLIAQIARRLGVEESEQSLLMALRDKEILLILDNFEHLIDVRSLVMTLLQSAPKLSVLVTSREALGLMGEQRFVLKGLSIPHENSADLEQADAIQLFAARANLQDPNFTLDAQTLPYVAAICRKLSGMPLAIELATSWLGVMNVQRVAQQLGVELSLLETDSENVLERHRSMKEVFSSSWRRLNAELQEVYGKLANLPDSFSQDDAQAKAGASLIALRSLVDKSLLEVDKHNGELTYHFPPLLKDYAAEADKQLSA